MANVAQSDLNNLSAIVEADAVITNAQKAKVQTLLYSMSQALFQNAANPPTNGHSG